MTFAPVLPRKVDDDTDTLPATNAAAVPPSVKLTKGTSTLACAPMYTDEKTVVLVFLSVLDVLTPNTTDEGAKLPPIN